MKQLQTQKGRVVTGENEEYQLNNIEGAKEQHPDCTFPSF